MPLNLLLDFLFPARELCVICAQPSPVPVCPYCHQAIESFQRRRREHVCHYGSLKVVALLPFEEQIRKNIHRLKFWNRPHIARELALAFNAAGLLPVENVDVVTDVPMHRARLIQRGYNQAELLAKEIASLQNLPYQRLLRRSRATEAQQTLGRTMRQKNVEGAFAPRGDLTGQRVLLVDDVLTTGNTARACVKALYEANASEVTVLVVAVSKSRVINY